MAMVLISRQCFFFHLQYSSPPMKSTAFAALKRERVHSTQTVAEMVAAHQTDPTAWPICVPCTVCLRWL